MRDDAAPNVGSRPLYVACYDPEDRVFSYRLPNGLIRDFKSLEGEGGLLPYLRERNARHTKRLARTRERA